MASVKPILIASDHAGFALKSDLQKYFTEWSWIDLGPADPSKVDYIDFAELVSQGILEGRAPLGILVCGSGVGMCIAANKHPGIRAVLGENPVSVRLSREHNHSNVLCLGARILAPEYAFEITKVWLSTPESHDPRHLQRLEKLKLLENSLAKKDGSS